MLISFLIFFTLFTAVGVASSWFKKNTVEDYFLASRNIPAWMVGMSYGATISSGATFIGFAGLAYHSGFAAIIATVALMVGDHMGWVIAKDKIRSRAASKNVKTYPEMVGKLGSKNLKMVTLITAILSVIFLGTYCSAQLVAGAKVGASLFDLDYNLFVLLGAGVLLAYCWAGGIRASIWTDAVQAFIIIFSLGVLAVVGMQEIGSFSNLYNALVAINPSLVDPFQVGFIAIAIGWLGFGVGVLGQPQLMVRHMVAGSKKELRRARTIYLSWRWVVLGFSVLTGFIARVLIPEVEGFDPELSIPQLWEDLLPPVLVGFLLAGLFSSTMSTADSLLLSASSALSQHILPKVETKHAYNYARLGTVAVIILIVLIALFANKGVLSLVILAWGGLASAVAPVVIVQLFGANLSQRTAVSMMVSGFITAFVWRSILELHGTLMELVPGMSVAFAVYFAVRFVQRHNQSA